MKKKIISILFIMIILIFALKSSCKAAGASIVCNEKVTVNEKITINVMVSGIKWDLELKVNGQVIASNSYNENVNKSLTFSGVYTPSTEGDITVTLTGDVKDTNGTTTDISRTKTITVESNSSEQESTSNSNTTTSTTTQNTQTTKKSSEARLSNLGITPNDFTGFLKDKTTYDVKVPNSVNTVKVYATPIDSKAKITGTGNVTLNEGINKVEVKVVAEDGTTKTYTLNITREEIEEEVNKTLDEEQEPVVTQIEPIGLKSLTIKNLTLSPKFDNETYEYTVELTEDISSLDIDAKATNSSATIEIIGNNELKNGETVITILLSDSETDESATYQIIVNKNVSSNEIVGKVNWLQPSTWGVKEKRIIGIIAIAVLVIVIIIVIRIKMRASRIEYMDLPGIDELDKAILEHQELSQELLDFEKFKDIESSQKFEFDKKTQIENINENVPEQLNEYINRDDVSEEISEINNTEVKEEKMTMRVPSEYFDYTPTSTRKKGKHF